MKSLILLTCLTLSLTALAQNRGNNNHNKEKLVGTITVDNRLSPDVVRIDSCQGRRDNKLSSLTLVVKNNDLDLKKVSVTYENRNGGRSSVSTNLYVRARVYPVNSRIKIDIPGAKCVDSISIQGQPEVQTRRGQPSRSFSKVEVYAKIQ